MNMLEAEPDPEGEGPSIIVIGFERQNYFLFRGDEFLDQILIADGEFPKPILCVHFADILAAKQILGMEFSTTNCWGIHPDIIARLRSNEAMVETDG